jgi:hypothetical protein
MPPSSSPFHNKNNNGGKIAAAAAAPRRVHSPFQPPPLTPLQLTGYSAGMRDGAKLLTRALAEEIRLLVPARLQLVEEWGLVFSLEQDGVSLATLYEKCEELRGKRGGYVLVVKDGSGGVSFVFFAFVRCPSMMLDWENCGSERRIPISKADYRNYRSSAAGCLMRLILPHTFTVRANVSSGEPLFSLPFPIFRLYHYRPAPILHIPSE